MSDPRGALLLEQDLADALGLPLPVARAMVVHQRIDGVETEDGRYGAYEADVQSWLRLHPQR